MQKKQKKVAEFKKMFEDLVALGVNPVIGYITTSNFDHEAYQRYVKSRFSVIKRGKDKAYRFKEAINFVIERVK